MKAAFFDIDFLLSPHSRLAVFQTYVVAQLPLRIVPAIQSLCWVS